MPELINQHQTAFVQDRFIAENFLATREVLHHVYHSKSPALLLKLDFAKAFDTLDWGFLLNVLAARGFPDKFVKWIFHLLSTSSSRIAINGTVSQPFTHRRGLRQGDPLSPFLFILAADVLQQMSTAISTLVPHCLTPKLKQPVITFQYADDTVIMLSAAGSTIRLFLVAIHCFSAASGLKVNFSKSAFVPLSITAEQVQAIENLTGCCRTTLPLTYLGMPLTLKAPTREDFTPLLRKLERRLEGWKSRFISRAGKLQLVKSVLSSIPTYYMSCFKLPKWLIERIDSIRRNFLWSRPKPPHAIHLLNWTTVCLPIPCGGLGVTNLQLQNASLMLRWLWRIFCSDQRLWKTYAQLLYAAPNPQPGPIILTGRGSFFWRSLLHFRPLFHSCSRFEAVSGKEISFWFDGWAGLPLLQKIDRTQRYRNISLFQARNIPHRIFRFPPTLHTHQLIEKITSFQPRTGPDRLHWTISSSRLFTVRSIYKTLSEAGKTRSLFSSLWKAKTTPTMRVFFFFLLNNRLLTHDVMLRRNLQFLPGCVMCSNHYPETSMHLFF